MRQNWNIQTENKEQIEKIMSDFQVSRVVAKILSSKNMTDYDEIKKFLNPSIEDVHDPFLLHDMKKSVDIINQAIADNKKILIYSDYDSDGITGATILMKTFQKLNANVDFVIPNRFKHGYGPNTELFEQKIQEGFELIITVDNGVSGIEPIKRAKELGIDVIVTDHHEFAETLPVADAIVHPRHPNGNYPFGDLAGVGVAYKLAVALLGDDDDELLEFFAIGSIADMVALQDENRYYVRRGLEAIKSTKNLGLEMLAHIGNFNLLDVDEDMVGFSIAPRINAPGRLGDPNFMVELFTTNDFNKARELALQVEDLNKERKDMTTELSKTAEIEIEKLYNHNIPEVLVIAKDGWETGVVGIAASRIVEKFYRPTILLAIDKETGIAKGSARSIDGFDLFSALNEIKNTTDILLGFGGHEMAAGLSLKVEHVEELRSRLIQIGKKHLSKEELIPTKKVDVSIDLNDFSIETFYDVKSIGPYGMGFSKPTFLLDNIIIKEHSKMGELKNHYRGEIEQYNTSIKAVSFFNGHLYHEIELNTPLAAIGNFNLNEWNGMVSLQFMMEDVQPKQTQYFDYRNLEGLSEIMNTSLKHVEYVSFNENNANYFLNKKEGHYYQLAIIDLPRSKNDIKKFNEHFSYANLYFTYHDSYIRSGWFNDNYFKNFYTFIKQQGYQKTEYDHNYDALKVFIELGFVEMSNVKQDFYIASTNPQKSALSNSTYYKKLQEEQMYMNELLRLNAKEMRLLFTK